jgi:iron complex outermembrane receptor protein
MYRSLLLSLLVSCSTLVLAAQQLTGKIVDKESAPVAGASISILNSNWSTLSDNSGNFSFNSIPAGKYTLLVSSIGYAAQLTDIVFDAGFSPINIVLEKQLMSYDPAIVTAQKREESLLKIPATVSLIGSTRVKEYRLWNSRDITALVPNLYSANSGDDRNVTSIRGITTTSYDPAVATYIDGVNQFSLDTYIANLIDVERIEVLRGPQGTLYGRNAMGGVINIVTKQPGNITSGFAELNFGEYGQQRYSAGLRIPLIKNKLFFSAAGVYQQRDGFYKNEFNNKTYDKQNAITANYGLKYLAGNNWSLGLNVKHHNARNNGAFPLVFGVQDALDKPFLLNQDALAKMIDNSLNASLSIVHSGKKFNFSSQTAYQSNHRYYNNPLDGDFSPIDGVTIINDYGKDWNRVKVFTQEIKFTSPASTKSALQWTAGAYFFHQDNPVQQTTRFGEDAELLGAPDKNFSVTNINKGKSTGLALFGQMSYAINRQLSVIGGLRVDYEKRDYTVRGEYQKAPDPVFVTTPDTSAAVDYNAISPKLGLSYQLTEQHILYASYSRGFRTGGLTQLGSDPSQPPLFAFKPEYSNNWEAGLKGGFKDGGIYYNIVMFYTRVNDVQVPTLVLPDAITVTRNAGKLRSWGGELELNMRINPYIKFDYRLGYTDAEYTSLKISQNGSEVNLKGKKQVFTPAYTSMLALQANTKEMKRWKGLLLFARAELVSIGKQYFDLSNNIEQKQYNLLNLRLGLQYNNIELTYWARNLADKRYIAYAYDFGAVHLGNPANSGIGLSVRF